MFSHHPNALFTNLFYSFIQLSIFVLLHKTPLAGPNRTYAQFNATNDVEMKKIK